MELYLNSALAHNRPNLEICAYVHKCVYIYIYIASLNVQPLPSPLPSIYIDKNNDKGFLENSGWEIPTLAGYRNFLIETNLAIIELQQNQQWRCLLRLR